MNRTQDVEGEMIQICTDIYYECKTIKELDRLTDKALALIDTKVKEAYKKGWNDAIVDNMHDVANSIKNLTNKDNNSTEGSE